MDKQAQVDEDLAKIIAENPEKFRHRFNTHIMIYGNGEQVTEFILAGTTMQEANTEIKHFLDDRKKGLFEGESYEQGTEGSDGTAHTLHAFGNHMEQNGKAYTYKINPIRRIQGHMDITKVEMWTKFVPRPIEDKYNTEIQ